MKVKKKRKIRIKEISDESIQIEAKKYKTKNDFKKGSKLAYTVSLTKGANFHNRMCSHMKNPSILVWTDKLLIKEAKKYKTKSDFDHKSTSAYRASLNKGLDFHDKICSHMENYAPKIDWTDEMLLEEGRKYVNKSDFKKGSRNAYQVSKNRGYGFLNLVCSHMIDDKLKKWTNEDLMIEASKYIHKSDFANNSNGAYNSARLRGKEFFDSICFHMIRKSR